MVEQQGLQGKEEQGGQGVDLMSEGRLSLTYLGTEPDVVAGDLIVTSGLAG